ncbi:ComF family protein [Alkalibacillus haloalkaliphilus]|uniref:ComF family protein n=1 Tax=Alkalibacillus haloalkaliphilus TaxID=94136 RepID=UPI0029365CAC|nr:ComF family protein [Alkalibacillus haloalkaliphilus]MDV2582840.1 ComF family protein [Alkalibacillus haloalkaliphilus]
MICYLCLTTIKEDTTWSNFLTPQHRTICDRCEDKLEQIPHPHCPKCMKPTTDQKCSDCLRWEQHFGQDPLERNVSIYTYNEYMKDLIARFKYRGDYELVNAWKKSVRTAFNEQFKNQNLSIVPIPLGEDRYSIRKFNQAEAIATLLAEPIYHILTRQDGQKQSKKSRRERVFSNNPFQITKKPPKSILLVDDIYTTGTTIRQAASLLKEKGAEHVISLTLIRS